MIHSVPVPFYSIPIERLRGVGPRIAARLREKGICTIEDLLYFCPISYINRTRIDAIAEAEEGKQSSFVGRIISAGSIYYRSTRKKGFQALLEDGTGSIFLNWFNVSGPHLKRLLDSGDDFFASGIVTRYGSHLQLIHPHIAEVKEGGLDDHCKIVPVYSEIQGVGQSIVGKLVREAFHCMTTAGFRGLVPASSENEHGMLPLVDALVALHLPEERAGTDLLTKARGRLILEEFFSFQTALFLKRKQSDVRGSDLPGSAGRYTRKFLKSLPFELTAAQKRVMKEIEADMTRNTSMNRLLQGDVGCGKTLCAVFAACLAMDCGFQVALMAPTEILAEQHYLSISNMLQIMGLEAALLTSSTGRQRSEVLNGLEKGQILFVIGTHALLGEDIRFSRLGLVIIDEQHKFGVLQRKAIIDKAFSPNVLAVTATPIPRTLSIVLYGHLDASIIDEIPPGRIPIKTMILEDQEKDRAYRLVLDEVGRGGQAYIVFPVIEEREEDELSGVLNQFEALAKGPFKNCRIGLLHGRLPVSEKDKVMNDFREREIELLACTTVVEVGLDLPNASVIVVHNAERFGLAQLHQLRGRVGRGSRASTCILLTDKGATEASRERLRIMEETGDGFRVAEADMALRGPGEVLGVRQSGLPKFRIGDVVEDAAMMSQARELARQVLPKLGREDSAFVREAAIERWGKDLGLVEA